jgi:hypothetical protein
MRPLAQWMRRAESMMVVLTLRRWIDAMLSKSSSWDQGNQCQGARKSGMSTGRSTVPSVGGGRSTS